MKKRCLVYLILIATGLALLASGCGKSANNEANNSAGDIPDNQAFVMYKSASGRWGIARNIVLVWILTFPACGLLGWLIASLLKIAA